MHDREQTKESTPDDLDELLTRGFRYALSLTHDRSDAEDLIQDAVTTMLAKRTSWQRSYLFATIRNRFIDGYRRKQNLKFVSLESETESDFANDAGASQPLDSLDVLEAAQLHEALGSLREDERETLFLAIVEGYTAEEIARLTERPRGTVLSLIFRAKRKLRETLATRCQAPGAASLALGAAQTRTRRCFVSVTRIGHM